MEEEEHKTTCNKVLNQFDMYYFIISNDNKIKGH